MTNLTEQWKKGELPNGYYYCKLIINNMKPSIERCKAHCIPMGVSADRGEEVLAEVPSYEEYLESESHCAVYSEINQWNKEEISAFKRRVEELKEENTKLKELLKECRGLLSSLQIDDYDNNGLLVIGKINQVLGEE